MSISKQKRARHDCWCHACYQLIVYTWVCHHNVAVINRPSGREIEQICIKTNKIIVYFNFIYKFAIFSHEARFNLHIVNFDTQLHAEKVICMVLFLVDPKRFST